LKWLKVLVKTILFKPDPEMDFFVTIISLNDLFVL